MMQGLEAYSSVGPESTAFGRAAASGSDTASSNLKFHIPATADEGSLRHSMMHRGMPPRRV